MLHACREVGLPFLYSECPLLSSPHPSPIVAFLSIWRGGRSTRGGQASPPCPSWQLQVFVPNHQRWHAKWKLSRNTQHVARTSFLHRLASTCMLRRCLVANLSASELRRKFVKRACCWLGRRTGVPPGSPCGHCPHSSVGRHCGRCCMQDSLKKLVHRLCNCAKKYVCMFFPCLLLLSQALTCDCISSFQREKKKPSMLHTIHAQSPLHRLTHRTHTQRK